jgi:hypothetical protein
MVGSWRKLHDEKLHNLYLLPNIITIIKSKRMRWAGHIARKMAKRNAYKTFVGKPEGHKPLGRPGRRWVDTNKIDFREIDSSGTDFGMIMSRRMRWAWHVARMGAKRSAYRILVGKPEGKRPLGRPRHR